MKLAFGLFDKDGSGSISLEDLKRVRDSLSDTLSDQHLVRPCVRPTSSTSAIVLTACTQLEMINEADQSGTGRVDFKEFVSIIQTAREQQ